MIYVRKNAQISIHITYKTSSSATKTAMKRQRNIISRTSTCVTWCVRTATSIRTITMVQFFAYASAGHSRSIISLTSMFAMLPARRQLIFMSRTGIFVTRVALTQQIITHTTRTEQKSAFRAAAPTPGITRKTVTSAFRIVPARNQILVSPVRILATIVVTSLETSTMSRAQQIVWTSVQIKCITTRTARNAL